MSSWLRSGHIPVTIALVMLLFFVSPAIAGVSDNLTVTGEILPEEGKDIDLTIGGIVNTVFGSAVFCNVPNEIRIINIKNDGTDTAENITVAVYDDAISTTVPVATTTIPSLAGGKTVTMTKLVDPTLREYEGGYGDLPGGSGSGQPDPRYQQSQQRKIQFRQTPEIQRVHGRPVLDWQGGDQDLQDL